MAALLTAIGDIFGKVISLVGDVATAITGNPLLLLYALIPLSMIAIGAFKRLLNN